MDFILDSTVKKSRSIVHLFLLLFIALNIKQSHQWLHDHDESHVFQKNYYQINLGTHITGPESIAFDCKGEGPYVGVSDGRILKWQGPNLGWKEFAVSASRNRKLCDGSTNPNLEPRCGRPLGLKFNNVTCDLYIADAYFGLLVVGSNGGVAQTLATSAEGIPFRFTNSLDIDTNSGLVYFTDSSTILQRRYADYLSRSIFDKTGRLLKYDPYTKNVSVISRGLHFPNGVCLNKDNSFLLVAESNKRRILKFRFEDEANTCVAEVFSFLPKLPDNIQRSKTGEFWVALNSGRLTRARNDMPDPIGIKYNSKGKILKCLDGNGGTIFNSVSEIHEFNGKLYIGSVTKSYIGVLYV